MRLRSVVILLLLLAVTVVGGAFFVIGLDGLSTRSEPSAAERVISRVVRRLSVPRRMRGVANPVAFSSEAWAEARGHFADHCASCHANNGSGETELGRSLYPRAPDMRLEETQQLTDGELYWIIEHGIRLTGMPAWGDGSDHDMETWRLVHFIRRLPTMTPEHLEEMESLNPRTPAEFLEEQQDRDFLDGKDPVTTPTTPPHQH